MNAYSAPDMEVVLLNTTDIIVTSGGSTGGNSGTETPDDSLWG